MTPLPLSTAPNAGIPAGARRKATADKSIEAAGVLFVTSEGDGLFIKRKGADHAGEWSIPAGKVEKGENFAKAARREAGEETGLIPSDIDPIHREKSEGVDFATFRFDIENRFDPMLNEESEEYVWASLTEPPEPLHPGLAKALASIFPPDAAEDGLVIGDQAIGLTFDRSARVFDEDGRMCVKVANISKEQIRPYKGSEIPGYEALKLDPETVYQIYCPGEELEKAAATFNGIQLLQRHIGVKADDHQMWDIVGTTGSEARYEAPYLKNSLFVWTQKGIDYIESKERQELSPGYYYDPDMTPGQFDGKPFDGSMRNIRGNHVAIVEEGRSGHDVIVSDQALDAGKARHIQEQEMKPTRLEYLLVTTAARAVNPLLAMDAKVDYKPIFKGLNSSNFKGRKTTIISDMKRAIKGKTVVGDASVEHLAKMLDHFDHAEEPKTLDAAVSGEEEKEMEAAAKGKSNLAPAKKANDSGKPKAFDESGMKEMLKSKGMSEDDISEVMDMMPKAACDEEPNGGALDEDDDEDISTEDEDADAEEKRRKEAAKDKATKDKAAKDKAARDGRGARDKGTAMDGKMITEDDMNRAITAAVNQVRKGATECAETRAFLRPYCGELPMALDSKEKLLRAGAASLGIEDAENIHASALPTLIKMQPVAGARQAPVYDGQITGDDFSGLDDFSKRFPGAARIGNA